MYRLNTQVNRPSFQSFTHVQNLKRTILSILFCLPASFLAVIFLLSVYNGFSVFYFQLSFSSKNSANEGNVFQHNVTGDALNKLTYMMPSNHTSVLEPPKPDKLDVLAEIIRFGSNSRLFSVRIREFLKNPRCRIRFFMTWISSLDSFTYKEMFSMESLFKSHPDACLVIVSGSLDSERGTTILKPFFESGFKLISVTPDFDYIFKGTPAETWFDELRQGKIDPGEISLGQNLSNLLRLVLVYKYGGVYIDTDVIVIKKFSNLRNVIGAQTVDPETGNWSRLNNAVLIFDKNHPLLSMFIKEFSLTFDGNRWGHNGPYLVSRVVSRVINNGDQLKNYTILPPSAFYPVDWKGITAFFKAPVNEHDPTWQPRRLQQIRQVSYSVHLWNKQSRNIKVENGSIIHSLMIDCCIFCNFSSPNL